MIQSTYYVHLNDEDVAPQVALAESGALHITGRNMDIAVWVAEEHEAEVADHLAFVTHKLRQRVAERKARAETAAYMEAAASDCCSCCK